MKTVRGLFIVISGSRLYGTAGPGSDTDVKVVFRPPLDDLLLNRKLKNFQSKEGGIEVEWIPLQVFLHDFFHGQTYALEMAMVMSRPGAKPSFWWMTQLIERFITSDVNKMMGYAVSQSRVYGLKAERYGHLKRACEVVQHAMSLEPALANQRLRDALWLIDDVRTLGCVKDIEIPNAGDGTELAPAVEIYGKKFPLSATWLTFRAALERSAGSYGERARGYEEDKVDRKALSHAIRIIEQIRELCQTGAIIFPRPNAQFLKDVKYGVVPTDQALAHLEKAYDSVEEAIEHSILPPRTPELTAEYRTFCVRVLRGVYRINAEQQPDDIFALPEFNA